MIEVLESDAALEALGPEWDALWARTPSATPFQSPRWLLPWWRQFGTGMPRVAIERRDGQLRAVLPLYVLPGERKALPIGAGTTDYLDALGDPSALVPAVLARLRRDPVDVCDLIEMPPGSALRGLAPPDLAPPDWYAESSAGSACPVLDVSEIPGPMLRKLRMNRNRAGRAGGWSVETAGPQTLPCILGELIRLHQRRWTAHGERGVLSDPAMVAFCRDATPRLLDAGLLRLTLLRIGNDPAAAFLALLAPGRIFFYLSGFDESHGFVSPGSLLLGAMLEQAAAEGRKEAHFLRGRERYKYAWGGVDRFNACCRLTPRGA